MKKLYVLLLVLLLFGCQIYLTEEKTPEYKDLKALYNNYLNYDIYDDNNFYSWINKGTLANISSTITIEQNDNVFSGVIFKKEHNTYYALTIINDADSDIKVYDYKNTYYDGFIENIDNEIAVIKFISLINYDVAAVCEREIFVNEVILTTGYMNDFQNAMKLGVISEINNEEITTSLLSDYFSLGAPVFDNELKLIGLQKQISNDKIIIININNINYLRSKND